MADKNPNWGGARAGAGRKPTLQEPKKVWSVKVTDDEKAKLKAYLEELRNQAGN